MAFIWFLPFFRKGHVRSAYEYMEHRFGLWARLYVGIGFVISQLFRTSIIFFAISVPLQTMFNLNPVYVILVFGIIVIVYTVAGGLEAVIWADTIQGIGLIIGGLICLPVICYHLPGGFSQIISDASAAGKTYLGGSGF